MAGRWRIPRERIAGHLSERAPTDAGSQKKHDYIGYCANIVHIFRLGGGYYKYVSDYLAGDYASVGCYNTLTVNQLCHIMEG